ARRSRHHNCAGDSDDGSVYRSACGMRKLIGIAALYWTTVALVSAVTAVSILRSDQGGTGANNAAAPNNAFAKWLSGTPATLTSSVCTESGSVIGGCTAPPVAHKLLSAQHDDTVSATPPLTGD